jgi:hypothetical protein
MGPGCVLLNFLKLKIEKFATNSTTTEPREKISAELQSLEI